MQIGIFTRISSSVGIYEGYSTGSNAKDINEHISEIHTAAHQGTGIILEEPGKTHVIPGEVLRKSIITISTFPIPTESAFDKAGGLLLP